MALDYSSYDTANSRLTLVASGTTAHTKNTTYTELIASTAIDANWMRINLSGANGASNAEGFMITIATGGIGSETAVVENITFSLKTEDAASFVVPVPTIPSGTRISATCQRNVAGTESVGVGVEIGSSSAFGTVAAIETIGANTSTTTGVAVDPGATANTLGGWTQITASTSHDYDWIIMLIDSIDNASMQGANFIFQIGTGGPGSETVYSSPIYTRTTAFETISEPAVVITPYEAIPSSTRISVRSQSSITDAIDRVLGISMIGVNMDAPSGGGQGISQGIHTISSGIVA